jgi:hypothetical protein
MSIVKRMLAKGVQKKVAVVFAAFVGLSMSSIASADQYPVITGKPKTSVRVGEKYVFDAEAYDPDGKKIVFAINNKPSWATFNQSTGVLQGTPTKTGTWSNIKISAWDGRLTKSLPVFSIKVTSGTSSGGSGGSVTNKPPTISGTPPTTATVGKAYSFTPSAKDPEGKTLGFTIQNRPSWATFSTSTGKLSGTPGSSHVTTYSNIKISVSDGTNTVSLPAFSIKVSKATTTPPPTANGAATLTWTPPTRNTDGSTLTNLAGYRIYYGTSANSLTKTINVNSAGVSSYVVSDLAPATYYFAVTAYNKSGAESARSTTVSKVIK